MGAPEGARLILVTGAGGQLGRALCETLGDRAAGMSRAQLDISDPSQVRAAFDEVRPSAVVNAAAFTNVDAAESSSERAHAVNALGAQHIARAAADAGAFLVHVSTDMVFDGTLGRPYRENDIPNPTSVYGASKLEGERLVAATYPRAAVVRTSWVYSPWGGFVRAMLAANHPARGVRGVTDIFGSPTWVRDLAAALVSLLDRPAPGVFHVAGAGMCSRYEQTVAAFSEAGVETRTVSPVTWEWYRHLIKTPAPRGACTALEGHAWAAAGYAPLRPWRDALKAAMPEILAAGV